MSQSDFRLTQPNALNSLSSSVASLRASISLLDSSISILAKGTADFPRLKTVLASTRHYELTPSSTLIAAQKSLAAEIKPAITTLLSRAETYIAKLERKQQSLQARSELLGGRLEGIRISSTSRKANCSDNSSLTARSYDLSEKTRFNKNNDNEGRAAQLKALKQKKERLSYTIERLVLQSQQRQRQLRLSVAAG
ncbi:DASH complex subunit SPC19 [Golovinomyces cichoracearum]|uniref:DASH complex subunit SPC19 n=1 Tax=Golovinomyces cichoracearum TaxID=62708 RepID=A0A420ISQ0_9PEZI|nr:DASH complex subunit SPC19 [Golovinomyces cichoracearum]